jgi:AcrR family transcriptional regulator
VTSAVPPSQQGRAYTPEEAERRLRAALTELVADGTPFRDLSVERIVGAAGMARSTFYKLYADKSGMLSALSAASLRRLYSAQRSWIALGRDVTRDDVRAGMRRLLEMFVEDEAVMRAVAEASVYDPAIRDAYHSGVRDYARAMERFIKRGRKEGWIADVPPADTSLALAWMTERTVSQVAPNASKARLDATAEALAGVVWATLFGAPDASA